MKDKPIRTATQKEIRRVLEWPEWPEGLEANRLYEQLHDDHDGTGEGKIAVIMGPDGDSWISTTQRPLQSLRFRTLMGGGSSIRVRNALMLLAYAIKLDQEERIIAERRAGGGAVSSVWRATGKAWLGHVRPGRVWALRRNTGLWPGTARRGLVR